MTGAPLSNDEIEVACVLLWFVKREAPLPALAEDLWGCLQRTRHGDYGGTASDELSLAEAAAVVAAAAVADARVGLDEDELALVSRLRTLVR